MNESDKRHLCRSRQERIIAGVCGGLADFFGINVLRIRIALLVLVLFGGLSLWAYIILWLIVPQESKHELPKP